MGQFSLIISFEYKSRLPKEGSDVVQYSNACLCHLPHLGAIVTYEITFILWCGELVGDVMGFYNILHMYVGEA